MCPVRKGVCVCTVCPGKCAPHGQDMCGAHFVGHTVHTYFTNIYTYTYFNFKIIHFADVLIRQAHIP